MACRSNPPMQSQWLSHRGQCEATMKTSNVKVYIQNLGYGYIVTLGKLGALIKMPDGTTRFRPCGSYAICGRRTR